jgi:hypothetical protein
MGRKSASTCLASSTHYGAKNLPVRLKPAVTELKFNIHKYHARVQNAIEAKQKQNAFTVLRSSEL